MKPKQSRARRTIKSYGRIPAHDVRSNRTAKAKPTAKWGWKPDKIASLNEIVRSYGGDPDGFWKQQSQSYESQLARRSLSELARFYSLLFTPGITYAEIRKDCPKWPKSSKQAGGLPSDSILSDIRMRFSIEKTIGESGSVFTFLEKFRSEAKTAQQSDVLDSVLRMLGDEVVRSKLGGMTISNQLKAVDRLLKANAQRISWAKVRSWLEDQTQKAIDALCEEAKGDPAAVQYLRKAEERIRALTASADKAPEPTTTAKPTA